MADLPLVKVDDSIDANGAMVVSCFPSVSMVSNSVAHFLVERLDLQFVGAFEIRDYLLYAWFKMVNHYHLFEFMQVSRIVQLKGVTN